MSEPFRTVPEDTDRMPSGVPFIIGNEAAERFSFYGMRSILYVFMTEHLATRAGEPDLMEARVADYWFHMFVFAVYFFPVLGALLSDGILGKYRTILWLSIVYCLGHLALSFDTTRLGLGLGLTLIALGSGGIKPCVSANVGDQFGERNRNLLERVYSWFYFSINFGSAFSTLLIPKLLKWYGPHVAFAVPGVLMFVATLIFWSGRRKFVHAPPGGLGFLEEALTPQGTKVLGKLIFVAACVSMFWALYDQHASTWIEQAKHMDRSVPGYESLSVSIQDLVGKELEPSQVQAANPILILLLIPLFAYVVYPTIERVYKLTALRKIAIGFLLTAASFAIVAVIEGMLDRGVRLHVGWQLIPYLVLTSGEIMVSVTGLEYFYSESPQSMKSIAMAIWLLAVACGNFLTANLSTMAARLSAAEFFWLFAGMMLAVAVGFMLTTAFFREKSAPAE